MQIKINRKVRLISFGWNSPYNLPKIHQTPVYFRSVKCEASFHTRSSSHPQREWTDKSHALCAVFRQITGPRIVVYYQSWKGMAVRRDTLAVNKSKMERENSSSQRGLLKWHSTPPPSLCLFACRIFAMVVVQGLFISGEINDPFLNAFGWFVWKL